MIDISRRMFCFGAAATLVVPAPKSFFILKPPPLVIPRPDKPFDLPLQQMLSLIKKLDEQMLDITAVPRWLAVDKDWYDSIVSHQSRPGSLPTG